MSSSWQADPTSTDPPVYYTTSAEDVTLRINPAALLEAGQSAATPTSTLVRLDTGASVTLDAPTLVGGEIRQRIRTLVAGVTYRLTVSFTASPSANVRSMTTYLVCRS